MDYGNTKIAQRALNVGHYREESENVVNVHRLHASRDRLGSASLPPPAFPGKQARQVQHRTMTPTKLQNVVYKLQTQKG